MYKSFQIFLKSISKVSIKQEKKFSASIMLLLLLGSVIAVIGFIVPITASPSAPDDTSYLSKLVLAENSIAAKNWANTPEISYFKVHIFNYTNIDRYFSGKDTKIKVEDLGPYTYQKQTIKTNVQYNPNNTVTYDEYHSFKFVPEKSNRNKSEQIVVPNVPVLGSLEQLMGFPSTQLLKLIEINAFINVSIEDFMWGYSDEIIKTDKGVLLQFGILMGLNDSKPTTRQIYTGVDDINKLGILSQYQGMDHLSSWGSDGCNRIESTVGIQFPPNLVKSKQPLHLFDGCRKIPLHFEKELIANDINALRYSPPMNVFGNSNDNPENLCYCDSSKENKCLPSGIVALRNCTRAPLYQSFPHFFSGDPLLLSEFEGIEPKAEKHRSFFDIHPRLGFVVDAAARMQLNIPVIKIDGFLEDTLGKMPNDLVLPLLWVEESAPELTDAQRTLIRQIENSEL